MTIDGAGKRRRTLTIIFMTAMISAPGRADMETEASFEPQHIFHSFSKRRTRPSAEEHGLRLSHREVRKDGQDLAPHQTGMDWRFCFGPEEPSGCNPSCRTCGIWMVSGANRGGGGRSLASLVLAAQGVEPSLRCGAIGTAAKDDHVLLFS